MRVLVIVALIAIGAACGKSEEQKRAEAAAEEVKKAAEAISDAASKQGPPGAAQGMQDMAKAMQGMAAAMAGADGKTVEPVSTDALKGVLPTIAGWEMGRTRTQRMTSPVAYAEAETQYKQGDKEIELKVVDTGYAQMLVAPWAVFMTTGFSRESDDGYEKSVTVGGHPGFERWRKNRSRGELNIFVGKRFLVTLEGRDLADTKPLHDFAAKMDFGRIAALK